MSGRKLKRYGLLKEENGDGANAADIPTETPVPDASPKPQVA